MEIRKFEFEDLDRVFYIAKDTLEEDYSFDFFIYLWQMSPDGFLVAEKRGTIVGFIIATRPTLTDLRILILAVDKTFRKQGIGNALLRRLLIKFLDIKKIFLEVRTDNTEAIAFYEKRGFRITSIVTDFYTDNSSAYRMEKNLF